MLFLLFTKYPLFAVLICLLEGALPCSEATLRVSQYCNESLQNLLLVISFNFLVFLWYVNQLLIFFLLWHRLCTPPSKIRFCKALQKICGLRPLRLFWCSSNENYQKCSLFVYQEILKKLCIFKAIDRDAKGWISQLFARGIRSLS